MEGESGSWLFGASGCSADRVAASEPRVNDVMQSRFLRSEQWSPSIPLCVMYVLAINCGSSSIKGKLFPIPSSLAEPLSAVANLGVSNISSKGEKVKIKVGWEGGKGKDVDEEGEDGGSVECEYNLVAF